MDLRLFDTLSPEKNRHERRPRVTGVLRPVKLVIENYPRIGPRCDCRRPPPENSTVHEVPFSGELFIRQDDFMPEAPNKIFPPCRGQGKFGCENAYIIKCIGCEADESGNVTLIRCEYDPTSKAAWRAATERSKARSTGWTPKRLSPPLCAFTTTFWTTTRKADGLFRAHQRKNSS